MKVQDRGELIGAVACQGAANACAVSPLAPRLTRVVRAEQAADLSGLILTASLVGQVVGVAAFVGIYLSPAPNNSAPVYASYRSIRGNPNCGNTLLSANHVIADIRSPSSVRTNNAYGRAMSVLGMGR